MDGPTERRGPLTSTEALTTGGAVLEAPPEPAQGARHEELLEEEGEEGVGPPPLEPPDPGDIKTWWQQSTLALFIAVPFAALVAAVPVLWGWGLTWRDAVIAIAMYAITGHGVTVGFHRYFTHRSFKAVRWLRVVLAVAGSMAIQGPIINWVADHRKHHRFSDREGDPHSPWRYGTTVKALVKGFVYAHVWWLFDWEQTSAKRYAPELVADRVISWVSRTFTSWVAISMLLPPLVGGLWTWSWQGALTAFFWGSLVRVCLLHHVTFSINSVCHMTGRRPFKTKDRSQNVWWLAIPSMGESWHNFHHAEPTSARHGARFLEIDTSAIAIWIMEKLHWVSDVRWPDATMIARRRITAGSPA
jgi:stearoyl-CoA desaturase (Delta-9 desaturase)